MAAASCGSLVAVSAVSLLLEAASSLVTGILRAAQISQAVKYYNEDGGFRYADYFSVNAPIIDVFIGFRIVSRLEDQE